MDKLVNYLDTEFSNSREKCVLIIEPRIPYTIEDQTFHKTPDAIIIKDNVICIIDLKAFYEGIIADCRPGEPWKTSEGETIEITVKKNPFTQAKEYHQLFLDYLNEKIINENIRKKGKKWSISNVYSWIVTSELSTVEVIGTDRRESRFFRVVPVEKVAKQLAFIGSKYKLTATNTEKIISSLDATRVTIDEWYRLGSESRKRPSGLIHKITTLMRSGDGRTQLKALNYIRELELKQHRTHIVRCIEESPYEKIRKDALSTLIEWQDAGLGEIFVTTLKDSSREIVNFTLEYLVKDGYKEPFATLSEMLKTKPYPMTPKILKAITSSGHNESGKTVFQYARINFFEKPFERFKNLDQVRKRALEMENSRDVWNEYTELIHEQNVNRHLIETTLECLGDIQYIDSVPWLIEIITKPTSLGYDTDNYTDLDITTDFMYIFRAATTALGTIGTENADLETFLLDRLPSAPEYFQHCIINLVGNLVIKKAVPILKPYLKDQENIAYNDVVKALERIGSEDAFNILAEAYIKNPDSYEGMNTGQALYTIDEERLMDVILEQLQSKNVKTRYKEVYLQTVRGSKSLIFVETLFDLLNHNKLSESAGWSLSFYTDNKDIFDRLMKLTWSEDPIVQTAALVALDKYFIKNPDELERFEMENASVCTRRIVAYYYSDSDFKHRLFNYANDPIKEIRNIVFNYISKKYYAGEFIVGSDSRRNTMARVAVEEEYLGINMKKKVVLIPKDTILEAEVSSFNNHYYGLYLKIQNLDGSYENMMLAPTYDLSWRSQETVKELFSKIKHDDPEKVLDNKTTLKLWKSIKKSLPKKPMQNWY